MKTPFFAGLALLIALVFPTATTAQPDSPDARPEGERRHIVTIRGCLNGTILTALDLPDDGLTPTMAATAGDRFLVIGDEELID